MISDFSSASFVDKENNAAIGVRGVKSIGLSSRSQQIGSFGAVKNNNGNVNPAASVPHSSKQLASLPSSQKQVTQRRAFGDITNKSSQAQSMHDTTAEQKETKHSSKNDQRTRAEQYSLEDRVERLAGKGWEELEAERKRDEQKALAEKVNRARAAMIQALSNDTPAASRLRDSEADDSDELDLTPEVVPSRPRPRSRGSAAVQREKAAAMWGTVTMKDLQIQEPSSLNLSSPFIQSCPSLNDLLVSSEEEDLLL